MYVNKTYNLTLSEPKEETYLLGEFEGVKFGQLQKPLTLVKDAPPPPIADKNEEKKRKFYKRAVQNSTYLLSSGEKQLNPPRLDPKTNEMITTEPIMTMKSRRYRDDDRYAVICLEEGQNQTITILDEKWVFSKNSVAMAPVQMKITDAPVYRDDEKPKPRRRRNGSEDDSENESNSHQDEKYQDDEDEFNPKRRKSQSESYDDSESEMNEDPEIAEIKRQRAKQREEEEQMLRKRKYEGTNQVPEAKRNFEDMKKIVQSILKKKGEMHLEDFKNEIGAVDYAFMTSEENAKEMFKFTEITGEGRDTTISLKKEVPRSRPKGQSRQKKQPPKK